MRPVLPTDLICAARAVMHAPQTRRVSVAQALIVEAETADWHRLHYGEMHPHFGDGTLAGAARNGDMADARTVCDGEFASALMVVLQTLIRRAALNRSRD